MGVSQSMDSARWALALLIGALLALALRSGWMRFMGSRVAKRRAHRAQKGETAAERILTAAGYRILDRQPSRKGLLIVNAEPESFLVRADFLVEKDGHQYVADAKTGDEAPLISTRATRRQLLEYSAVYGVNRALLVDSERKRIHTITVDLPRPKAVESPFKPLGWRGYALAFLAGAATSVAVYAAATAEREQATTTAARAPR